MENHPVPQNISSYEFRLVGDMTLKQFLQLAAGIVVGVLFIRLQLLPIIKYPLAFISFVTGFLMAFVPINGRPFTSWLMAFIKAIYSPTEFVWLPDSVVAPPPPAPKPAPVIAASVPVAPVVPLVPKEPPLIPVSAPVSVMFSSTVAAPAPAQILTSTPVGIEPAKTVTQNTSAPPVAPSKPAPAKPTVLPPPKDYTPVIKNVAPTVSPGSAAQFMSPLQKPQSAAISSAPSASTTSLISPPTSPNILSGLVMDPNNQPLPATTVEIVDTTTGIPARALRTNKLGQFQIAIPLPSGSYNVIVEKDGYVFDQVSIQIKGGVVPPVILQGKKV
jgi:hypothetical protein